MLNKRKFNMKNTILATMLALATTAASAQVTVYGRLSEFVDSTKTGTTTVKSVVNDSSRIGFKVEEKLGTGLTARVVVETSVAADDPKTGAATQLGDRQSTVGLASRLGSVDLGRKEHSEYLTMKAADPFGGATYASVSTDIVNERSKRIGDGAFLATTVGPVSVAYDRSMYSNPATVDATSWSLGGTIGPVTTAVARFSSGSDYTTLVTVSGQVAGLTLSTIQSEDKTGAVETKGRLYGVTVPVNNAVSVKGSYGTKTGLAAGDVTAYNVGVNYAFSKRTNMLVAYRSVDAGGTANDIKQVGIGLSHSF
jgi:predicted porin